MDKKGLMAAEEDLKKRRKGGDDVISLTGCKDLSHKHPVSALMELSTKRKFKKLYIYLQIVKSYFLLKCFTIFRIRMIPFWRAWSQINFSNKMSANSISNNLTYILFKNMYDYLVRKTNN